MMRAGRQLTLAIALRPAQATFPRREVLRRALIVDSPRLDEAVVIIQELWQADISGGDMSQQTYDRYADLVNRFRAFAERLGCHSLDDALTIYPEWLNAFGRDRSGRPAPPSLSVRHLRSCAIGALYRSARSLGWTMAHPPYVTRDVNSTTRQGRPLVEPEFQTLRSIATAMRHSRHGVAIAIGFSGGGTADIANMTVNHVDLDDGTLLLPGSRHVAERRVRIPGQWEYDTFAQRICDLKRYGHPKDIGLVVRRQGGDASRQAGAAIAISQVLTRAQLKSDPTLKPASLCRWAALVAFETTGDISAAAALLGTGSLDTAAAAIGWDWTREPAQTNDPRPDYRPGVIA